MEERNAKSCIYIFFKFCLTLVCDFYKFLSYYELFELN